MRLWNYVSQAILAPKSIMSSSPATPSTALSRPAMANSNSTLYFGYGSNLWRQQMEQRCPHSSYKGVARLNAYKWLVNERGYANVVEISRRESGETEEARVASAEAHGDEVWGLVYALRASDEARLDRNEGVPVAYAKEWLGCDLWPVEDGGGPADLTARPERVEMLVYINREQVTPGAPKKEYIYRMNKGIDDAVGEGVPEKYVEEVVRKFIPESDVSEDVVGLARKQAVEFEDEE